MSGKPGFPAYDPSVAVDAALTKLETFTEKNAKEETPHVFHFTNVVEKAEFSFIGKAYKIKQEMKMVKSCIAAIFSTKARATHDQIREKVQNDLLEAICVLKNHYPYINKLNSNGNPLHQSLVKRFFATIKKFNDLIDLSDKPSKKPKSLWRVLRAYLCTVSGLSITEELIVNKILLPAGQRDCLNEIPSGKRFQRCSPTPEINKVSSLFLNSKVSSEQTSTPQDHELFWMKALSLLKTNEIHFDSVEEAFQLVKQTPIYTTLTPDNSDGNSCSSWILDMQQILVPYPGEKIIIKGKVKKTHATSRSTPIPDSFTLKSVLTQTDFPFCSQHTGWALCDALIPQFAHRLDLLPLVAQILKMKMEMNQQFPTENLYIERAKYIYKLKRKAFHSHTEELLQLHEKLCLAILNHITTKQEDHETIQSYFEYLRQVPEPFDILCETHQAINEHFIIRPYLILQNEWTVAIASLADCEKIDYAQQILQQERQTQESFIRNDHQINASTLQFVLLMGRLLGDASAKIILQEFSEIMNFFPPTLSDFEQKLQLCAFQQVVRFNEDLKNAVPENTTLRTYLIQDIELFSNHTFKREIPDELSSYFETRYMFRKENLKHNKS